MALYDLRGAQTGRQDLKTDDYRQAGVLLIEMAEQLLRGAQLAEEKLWGICLGIPGIIDRSRGYVVKSTVLPVAADNPFCSQLRERFPKARVLLENQSSLCAYAEQDFQAETGFNHLLYMDIGIGIGAGIVLDGRLIRGADGLAGEIGHMTIDLDGPTCPCGSRGCLERLASVPALIQRVIAGLLAAGRRAFARCAETISTRLAWPWSAKPPWPATVWLSRRSGIQPGPWLLASFRCSTCSISRRRSWAVTCCCLANCCWTRSTASCRQACSRLPVRPAGNGSMPPAPGGSRRWPAVPDCSWISSCFPKQPAAKEGSCCCRHVEVKMS